MTPEQALYHQIQQRNQRIVQQMQEMNEMLEELRLRIEEKKEYSVKEAAIKAGKSEITVRRAIEQGRIISNQPLFGMPHRIPASEIEKI